MGSRSHPLSYAVAPPPRRRRRIRHALTIITIIATGYIASYYAWVRDWEGTSKAGQGSYSLHYDRISNRRLADTLQRIHEPLRLLDEYRYARVYDLDPPEIPEIWSEGPPDFEVPKLGLK